MRILQDQLWAVYEGTLHPDDLPLTQGELGELLECAQQTAASYLAGTPLPIEAFEALCANLGRTPIELLLAHPRCSLEVREGGELTRKQRLLHHLGQMYSLEELTRLVVLHEELDAEDFETALAVLDVFAKRDRSAKPDAGSGKEGV